MSAPMTALLKRAGENSAELRARGITGLADIIDDLAARVVELEGALEKAFREGFGVGVVCGFNCDTDSETDALFGSKVEDRAWGRSDSLAALPATEGGE